MNNNVIFRKFKKNILIFLFIFLIIIGKIVRYTIMEETLVKPGIGHSMIDDVASRTISFGLTFDSKETDDSISASDNATSFFSLINFFKISTYEGMEIYISIIWNMLLLLLMFRVKDSLSIFEFIFLALSIVVLNIFDFCLAKEPVQMLYFILIYFVLTKCKSLKKMYIFTTLIILFSAITFRLYYILIISFMFFCFILFNVCFKKIRKLGIKHIIIICISIFLLYFVILNICNLLVPDIFNELLRVRLRTSSAATDMRAIFKSTNLFVFCLDYLIMLIRMLIPFELLRLGPKYLLYVIYQVMITFIIFKSITRYKNLNQASKVSLYLIIAFIMTSATFEPDFGSWIRHEAVIFPIILIVSNILKKNNS